MSTTDDSFGVAQKLGDTPSHRLSAREVLDTHADLQQTMANPRIKPLMERYAFQDIQGKPEWAPSHLNPAVNFNDLGPWFRSLSDDLVNATTYQVSPEMVALAQAIWHASPDAVEITEDELPADSGFMWLDTPVPRPSDNDGDLPPLEYHALSWQKVPSMGVNFKVKDSADLVGSMPGVRIREWSYTSRVDVEPRPLYMIGQTTLVLGGGIHTRMSSHIFLRTLWLLMGMEIVTSDPQYPDRHGKKRAARLNSDDIRVVQLRRKKANKRPDTGPRKEIDWKNTWIVRGHWRHPSSGQYKDGRTRTWVKPHLKGPDGMPLKAADVLYRLSQ